MSLYEKLHLNQDMSVQALRNTSTMEESWKHYSQKPANFLLASDPFTGEAMWRTQDEHDEVNPYKGLPDKRYIRDCLDLYQNERIILVEKSRQMVVSTFTCGYIAWECAFIPGRLWLISKTKEADSIALMRDKIRGPLSRMPDWIRERMDIDGPQNEIVFRGSGSRILGVTENVARSSGRGMTASGFLLDEAAFQDQARDIWASVMPMAKKLILVSTPSVHPGGVFMKSKIDEAQKNGELVEGYSYE